MPSIDPQKPAYTQVTNPSASTLKSQLRVQLRTAPVDAAGHTERIRSAVRDWLETQPRFQHISLFHPMPDEPNLLPLMQDFSDRNWHFPRISKHSMTFHVIRCPDQDLAVGHYGIHEPLPTIPPTPPHQLDLFLCPGLAFDLDSLTRLGRGKGYYDRYLAQARADAFFAGIAFPSRIVPTTHAEPHDIRMHRIFC